MTAILEAVRKAHNSISGAKQDRFIGSHPRDISRSQLQSDRFAKSYVTEKKDGTRAMLSLVKVNLDDRHHAWVMTNRRNESWIIQADSAEHDVWLDCSVVDIWDGELCGGSDGIPENVLWIFDCLMTRGEVIVEHGFEARQALLGSSLHNRAALTSLQNRLRLCVKPMTQLRDLDETTLTSLGNGWEGLVFYSSSETYYAKDAILRWKHPKYLTIDVLVRPTTQPTRSELLAWTGQNNYCFLATVNLATHPKPPEGVHVVSGGVIGEFALAERHRHLFMRWRTDKYQPDHINKIKQIREDFKNPILIGDIRTAIRSSGSFDALDLTQSLP